MLNRLSNHVQPRISRMYTNFARQTSNLRALCVLCGELRNSLLALNAPALPSSRPPNTDPTISPPNPGVIPNSYSICRAVFPLLLRNSKASCLNCSMYVRYRGPSPPSAVSSSFKSTGYGHLFCLLFQGKITYSRRRRGFSNNHKFYNIIEL